MTDFLAGGHPPDHTGDTPAHTQPGAISYSEKEAALREVFGEQYGSNFDDPVLFQRWVCYSPAVKSFYRREFPLISRTLFAEAVYRRRPTYNQTVLDDFVALVEKKIEDIKTLLQLRSSQMAKILRDNGINGTADYMHPAEKLVPIIAGGARQYINVLTLLDTAYTLAGSAVLNGVITSKQRKEMELLCRKAVRAFSAMLRSEIIKLRKESQRMRAADGAAPDDAELTRVEQAQDQAVAAFDTAAAAEAAGSPGDAVAPEDGARVLQELAASTNAVTRPRKARTAPAPEAGDPPTAAPAADQVAAAAT